MSEIISIGLQLETQALQAGARQAVTTLRDLEQASARTAQSTRQIQESGAQAATGLRATGTGATTAARALDPFVISTARATQETRQLARASAETGNALRSFGQQVGAAALGFAGASSALQAFQTTLQGARFIVDATVKIEALGAAFKAITGSTKAGGETLGFIREQAQRLGVDFVTLAEGYKTLAAASRGTELEGQKSRDIFLAIAEAGRVLQLSTHQMGGAIMAVGQMISKGQVMAEEWRQQLGEHLPIATAAATKALGVTTAEFFRMMEAGELGLDFLVKWAAQMRKDVAGGVEEASHLAGAAFARLGNATRDLATSIGQSGIVDGLARIAEELAKIIDRATKAGPAMEAFQKRQAAFAETSKGIPIDPALQAKIEAARTRLATDTTTRDMLAKQDPNNTALLAIFDKRIAAETRELALLEKTVATVRTRVDLEGTAAEAATERLDAMNRPPVVPGLRRVPEQYREIVRRASEQYGLDAPRFAAQLETESDWKADAISPKGAMGIGQLMPPTARAMGVTKPFDPWQNIYAAARLRRELLDQFGGNETLADMAYNAGPAAVRSGKAFGYKETVGYTQRIQSLTARNRGELGAPEMALRDPDEVRKEQQEAEQERKKAEHQAEADEKARVNRVLEYNSRIAEAEQKVADQKLEMERKLDDEITKLAVSERDLYMQRAESAGFAGDELDRLMAKYDDISQLKLDDKGLKFLQDLEAETRKLTMTEAERLKVQIEEMGLSADLTRQLLEQTQALKAARADKAAEKLRQDLVEETDKYKTPREQFLAEIDRMDLTPGKRGELLAQFDLTSATKEWDEFRKKGLDVIEDLSEGLADFVLTGKLDFQSLANAAIAELLRISIKKTLTSLYESDTGQQALEWLGKAVGVATSIGRVGGAGGQPGNYNVDTDLYPRAAGGPVRAGRAYLVGERGMELFTPPTNGVIIPHHQLRYDIPRRQAGGPVLAGRPYLVGETGPELVVPQRALVPTGGAVPGTPPPAPVVHINIYAQDAPSVIRSRSEIARGMVQALQGAQRSA